MGAGTSRPLVALALAVVALAVALAAAIRAPALAGAHVALPDSALAGARRKPVGLVGLALMLLLDAALLRDDLDDVRANRLFFGPRWRCAHR